jgi:hypothetical protein
VKRARPGPMARIWSYSLALLGVGSGTDAADLLEFRLRLPAARVKVGWYLRAACRRCESAAVSRSRKRHEVFNQTSPGWPERSSFLRVR